MSRPPRLDYAGARHHVFNRGARKAPIFRTDEDCQTFLDLLAECPLRFGVQVHAYCLMGNHFHLLLSTPRANLAEVLGFLQSRFARRQNEVHHWDGPLFRARYRNRVVEHDAYWRHLLAYVHLNPVEAHLVGRPEDARWTSHRAYVGLDRCPDWLETGELLGLFGGPDQLRDYVHEVQIGRERGPAGFDSEKLWTRQASAPLQAPAPAAREDWPGTVPPDQALAEICRVTGVERDALDEVRPGRTGNPARQLAMWWLPERCGLGTSAVASLLGCAPPVVSRARTRVRLSTAPHMLAWKDALVKLAR